jgi:hypothetical protein
MNSRDYVKSRAIELQNELDELNARIDNETDIVLKENACNMFDQRKQFMYNHAGRNPIEFAKLIADSVIDLQWANGLFTGDYHTRKHRKEVIEILLKSPNPLVSGFSEWQKDKGKWG